MENIQRAVREFHKKFGLLVNEKPTIPSIVDIETSANLINEEFIELLDSCSIERLDTGHILEYKDDYKPNIIEVADALGDILYVVMGMANRFGIDMELIFDEIHRSNMTKIGGHINENGKYIKPSTYSPANLEPILILQGWKKDGV